MTDGSVWRRENGRVVCHRDVGHDLYREIDHVNDVSLFDGPSPVPSLALFRDLPSLVHAAALFVSRDRRCSYCYADVVSPPLSPAII